MKVLAYDIPTFCEVAHIGRTKVYEEIKARRLRAVKCGGRTIILDDDAKSYLSSLPPARTGQGR